MRFFEELKAQMDGIQQKKNRTKKSERAVALKESRRICKEFGFIDGKLKGAHADGWTNT